MRVETAITGGLVLVVDITLQLRGDVRGYRLQPDGQRLNGAPMLPLTSSVDSVARHQASGEISRTVQRDTTTVTSKRQHRQRARDAAHRGFGPAAMGGTALRRLR